MSEGKSICGADCSACDAKSTCGGCAETCGKPFGGECIVAECCKKSGYDECGKCLDAPCALRKQLISEFNSLGISDMEEITCLYALSGAFVNMEYAVCGNAFKLLDDSKIYLGNQVAKGGRSDRCYGLAADANNLLVCEYGENGSNPEIVVYKRR